MKENKSMIHVLLYTKLYYSTLYMSETPAECNAITPSAAVGVAVNRI